VEPRFAWKVAKWNLASRGKLHPPAPTPPVGVPAVGCNSPRAARFHCAALPAQRGGRGGCGRGAKGPPCVCVCVCEVNRGNFYLFITLKLLFPKLWDRYRSVSQIILRWLNKKKIFLKLFLLTIRRTYFLLIINKLLFPKLWKCFPKLAQMIPKRMQ